MAITNWGAIFSGNQPGLSNYQAPIPQFSVPQTNINLNSSGFSSYKPTTAAQGIQTQAPSSGGGGGSRPAPGMPGSGTNAAGVPDNQPQQADPYAGVRNDISSAWDSYLGSLGQTTGYLNDQNTAQTNIANSQFQQGQDTINNQKASSLKDIANTTRNAFQAGNNYLGSLGAGDSSAANQYSFAINQQAGKQTGDLNNFVNTQMQQLQSTHDQQTNQIAQWFAQQQEALKQQIAQGQLSKGQDLANLSKGILDQAMQATQSIKANTQNQYNALVTWAANNSQNLGQLQQNIAGIPQAMGQLSLGAQGQGVGGGNPNIFGGGPQDKNKLFG